MASKFPNTETPDSGIRPGHSTPAFRSMGTRLGSLCLTLLFISHGAKGQQSESNIPDLPPPTTIGSVPAVSSTVAPPFAPALAPASTSPQPGSAPSLESPPQPNPSVPLDLAPPSAEIRAPSSLPRVIEIASQTPGTPSVPAPPSPGDGLPEALVAQPESDALATDPEAEFLNPIQEGKSVIEVVVGRSKIFESKRPFGRILISDPAVADVQLLDQESIEPKLLNLFGLRFGTTSLTLWDTNGRSETFTVRVTIDVPDLQARIAEIFPGADVSIRQIGSQIILEGEVPNAKVMNEVLRLVSADLRLAAPPDTQGLPAAGAGASGGGGNLRAPINVTSVLPGFGVIINRVRVPGPRQVLLRVKIAELNRTAMRQLGVSWLDTRSNNMIGSTVGAAGDLAASGSATQAAAYAPLSLIPGAVSNPITSRMLAPAFSPVASAFNAAGSAATNANTQLFGIFNAGEFNIFINALRTNRIAKILAEPNLVSLDGQPARFQAGGSFPYPVPQAGAGGVGSVITIQYAQFGASSPSSPTSSTRTSSASTSNPTSPNSTSPRATPSPAPAAPSPASTSETPAPSSNSVKDKPSPSPASSPPAPTPPPPASPDSATSPSSAPCSAATKSKPSRPNSSSSSPPNSSRPWSPTKFPQAPARPSRNPPTSNSSSSAASKAKPAASTAPPSTTRTPSTS